MLTHLDAHDSRLFVKLSELPPEEARLLHYVRGTIGEIGLLVLEMLYLIGVNPAEGGLDF